MVGWMSARRHEENRMAPGMHRFGPPADPPDESPRTPAPLEEFPADGEDLAYRVEVWDAAGALVEQVVAISATASIGYAAYFAATREYPGRTITLRHRSMVISRWTGGTH
jgi:hypothetical protein